jgi:hypothetical protein
MIAIKLTNKAPGCKTRAIASTRLARSIPEDWVVPHPVINLRELMMCQNKSRLNAVRCVINLLIFIHFYPDSVPPPAFIKRMNKLPLYGSIDV